MSHTKYDLPNQRGNNLINMQRDYDAQSVNSKKTNGSKYKKYNIKDYNNL